LNNWDDYPLKSIFYMAWGYVLELVRNILWLSCDYLGYKEYGSGTQIWQIYALLKSNYLKNIEYQTYYGIHKIYKTVARSSGKIQD
jgi:hypothetical protein